MGTIVCGWLVGCAPAPVPSSSPDASASRPQREPPREPSAERQGEPAPAQAPAASPVEDAAEVAPPGVVEAITGIPDCDAYLELYARCEARLRPEIMAGDRRFYAAEKASLVHLSESAEAPALPDACAGMLAELRDDCPQRSTE